MKSLIYWLVLLVVILVVVYGVRFWMKVQVSKKLISAAAPFEIKGGDLSRTMLILGDSTAVGVGADKPEDSLAGIAAGFVHATYVENRSVSGAVTADLKGQIERALLPRYDIIIIMIGGNDIIRFHGVSAASMDLASALESLHAGKIITMAPGNVGGSTLFPYPITMLHTRLNQEYHEHFARVSAEAGTIYVNLYRAPETDQFVTDPEHYLAPDGLHPSSLGYREWFDRMKSNLGV